MLIQSTVGRLICLPSVLFLETMLQEKYFSYFGYSEHGESWHCVFPFPIDHKILTHLWWQI